MKPLLWQATRLKRMSKEAFDNLPCGVCFFDMNGMVTLCSYQMHRLVFALTGRDLQSFSELNGFLSANTEKNEHNVFTPDDGSVWQFSQEIVAARDGRNYIQVLAADVTELYHRQKELELDNRRLEEYALPRKCWLQHWQRYPHYQLDAPFQYQRKPCSFVPRQAP